MNAILSSAREVTCYIQHIAGDIAVTARNTVTIWLSAILICLGASPATANCGGYGSIPVNQIYKYDTTELKENCIKEGEDPPREWLCRGSGFCSTPTAKVLGKDMGSIKKAHSPTTAYLDENPNPTYEETKPGGKSDEGATSSSDLESDLGSGWEWPSNQGIDLSAFDIIPEIGGCLSNLMNGSSEGLGSIVDASGNAENQCASGRVGICGLVSVSGNVCKDGRINGQFSAGNAFSKSVDTNFVPLDMAGDVYEYVNNDLNRNSTLLLPGGGTIDIKDASGGIIDSITMGDDTYVSLSPTGQLNIGNLDNSFLDAEINLEAGDLAEITADPESGLQIDSNILAGDTVGVANNALDVVTETAANVNSADPIGNIDIEETLFDGAIGADHSQDEAGAFPPDEFTPSITDSQQNTNAPEAGTPPLQP